MKHRKRARKTGLPPGSLVHIGERQMDQPKMTLIDYTPDSLKIEPLQSIAQAAPYRESASVTWVNIVGLHDAALLEEIGRIFAIHPLILEDIANTDQRPKFDPGEQQLFVVARMLRCAKDSNLEIESEQVSFVVGPNYLLTFQEKEGDVFDSVRERIRQNKGRLRKSGPDYLAYALLDLIVDNYFNVLEQLADEIDALETEVIEATNGSITHRIHQFRHTLLTVRKAAWPLREVITSLLREESDLMPESIQPFLRDLHDHTIQILDTIENYRDLLSGLLDVHFSNTNNRMGDVMKVLTIIATIFIPLTFVVGVYGMNFQYMPELHWKWAYPIVLLLMLGIALAMVVYFRLKKWL